MTSLQKHAFWSAGAAIVLTGSRFALAAVLARRLSHEAFGQYAYAQWLVDISFLLLTFGATGAVSRYTAEFRHYPVWVAGFLRVWRRYALLLPFGAGLVAVLGSFVSHLALTPTGRVCLVAWTVSSGLWAMQTAALTGLQRFDLIFQANVLAALTMVGGAFFIPMQSTDPSRALLLMACASLLAAAVGFLAVSKAAAPGHASLSMDEQRRIVRYAINIWLTAVLWNLVWSRGEVPIVRAYLGDASLAGYSVALTLLGGAIAGVMLGIGGLAPQVTRFWGEGRRDEAVSLCRKVMDMQLLTCGAASLGLVWLAPELLRFGFGEGYVSSVGVLCVLALMLPTMVLSLHNHLLQIVSDSRFNRDSTIAGLVVLMLAAILFVPRFGIAGAAIARVTALFFLSILTFVVFFKRFGPSGLGGGNVVIVAFALIPSAAFMLHAPQMGVDVRTAFLLLTLAVVFFGVRNRQGGIVLLGLWDMMRLRKKRL